MLEYLIVVLVASAILSVGLYSINYASTDEDPIEGLVRVLKEKIFGTKASAGAAQEGVGSSNSGDEEDDILNKLKEMEEKAGSNSEKKIKDKENEEGEKSSGSNSDDKGKESTESKETAEDSNEESEYPFEFEQHPKMMKQLIKRCANPKCKNPSGEKDGDSADASASTATKPLAACTQCKVVFYCGKDCQKDDWPNHKTRCKTVHKLVSEKKYPVCGVSLKWLLSDPIAKKMLEVRSTEDAIHHVFIPMTKDSQTSVAEHLLATSPKLVKPVADTFISHSWSYDVEDLLQALFSELGEWCQNTDVNASSTAGSDDKGEVDDLFIWIDFLCLNQHQPIVKDGNYLTNIMPEMALTINHTTMIANTFVNPGSLQRSWCIWETVVHSGRYRIGMKEPQRNMLWKTLRKEPIQRVLSMFASQLSFERADASEPEIRQRVFDLVKNWKNGGPRGIVRIIADSVRSWLVEEMLLLVEEMKIEYHDKSTSRKNQITAMLEEQEELSEIASMYDKLHWLLHGLGRHIESEQVTRKSHRIIRHIFGKDHLSTANARERIAVALSHQQRPDDALKELKESLRVCRLAESVDGQVSVLNNMGYCLLSKDNIKEAEKKFLEVVDILKKSYNSQPHPELADALKQLAELNGKMGNKKAAQQYMEEAQKMHKELAARQQS